MSLRRIAWILAGCAALVLQGCATPSGFSQMAQPSVAQPSDDVKYDSDDIERSAP